MLPFRRSCQRAARGRAFLAFHPRGPGYSFRIVTAETFDLEIAEALKAFDKYVVCLDKTPEECRVALFSLMEKAIKAYANRGPHLRHGIALDKHVTIILSQTDHDRPLCGIYFNLSSPYNKRTVAKVKKVEEKG